MEKMTFFRFVPTAEVAGPLPLDTVIYSHLVQFDK